ncbi:hypothetical protein OIO90_003025 [Microbotryomycetes sp. JL221]|nr:hypothetical protein OIO90_003025 [Microbotryomycetes sp. JL221]
MMRATVASSSRLIYPTTSMMERCTCGLIDVAASRRYATATVEATTRATTKKARAAKAAKTLTRKSKTLPSHLPQTELFQKCVNLTPINHRPSLINDNSARDLVRAWGIDKMHDVTVLECYPGPGGLTRAFLELKNVKKVIAIEEAFRYHPLLESAKQQLADPDRLHIVKEEPFLWETYSQIENDGLLKDVPVKPFDRVHDNFFLACQMPNHRHGEQLFVQFLSTTAGRMWLWKLGRFRMGFIGSVPFFNKILAPPGSKSHHKLSVLIPALVNVKVVETMTTLSPPEQHFHKPRHDPAIVEAVEVVPHVTPLVQDYEVLEFVARNMFVSKSQSWTKGIAALSAGASNLIPEMQRRGMPADSTPVKELSLEHWKIISDVYTAWPFKDNIMFDDGQWTME